MIDNVTTSSSHLFASMGGSSLPYISDSMNPMQGAVRCTNQRLEVWNGSVWLQLYGNNISVGMTGDAELALNWAIKQAKTAAEEDRKRYEIEQLAQTNVTVADALNRVKEIEAAVSKDLSLAKEQLEAIVTLVKQEPAKVIV